MGVEQLLLGIPETASDHEAQEGLRLALGDPSLQLILWQAAHDRYVDIDGQPFRPPEASETRVATPIVSVEQGRLGLLVHDRALLEDRDALLTVAAVTRMALQRRRLRADLEARLVELERERDFIRDVVSAAPTYFIVIDLDGTIVRYNDALVAATGIPDDERVRGRRFEAVFVARAAQADVAGLIALQAPGPHEHGWVGQDDVELTVEWSLTPISDEHGENRLLMTGMDVSHRVQHELELERQRDFLRSISNATPSLLAVVHADGIVDWTGVNHAFCLATGFDDARSVGRYFWDLVIPPEQIGRFQAAFRASVDDSVETRYEMPWLSVDGGELIVEWFVTSLESYRPDHYLICGVDVTERRRQEDEVRRSRTRLVQAADAERRRLERNLHDGAQQRLISMALTL